MREITYISYIEHHIFLKKKDKTIIIPLVFVVCEAISTQQPYTQGNPINSFMQIYRESCFRQTLNF